MKVLAIKGSPRKHGNSSLLMKKMLNGLKEEIELSLKIINPYDLNIKPCINCDHCQKEMKCVFEDDMQSLYKDFEHSDMILVSTSVFFNGIPSQLKAMIDRCQVIWSSKYIFDDSIITRDKKCTGYLVATGGAPDYKEQFCCVINVIKMFFKVINADFKGKLLVANVDKQPVKDRKKLLKKSYQIGLDLSESIH